MTDRYRLCNDCQRPFIVPILSRQFNIIFCPFCNNSNTSIISMKQYRNEVTRLNYTNRRNDILKEVR